MDSDNVLMVVAMIAVIVALIAAGFTYMTINNITKIITGYGIESGSVNLTIESVADFNFTKTMIDFGSGKVSLGYTAAHLISIEGANNVSGGNWSLKTAGGLQIENIGNNNLTLNLSAGKSANNFIGGTNPGYWWNITNLENGACVNTTTLGVWLPVNYSTGGVMICNPFRYESGNDEIRIDINLTIPENSKTGVLSDVITGIAVASP